MITKITQARTLQDAYMEQKLVRTEKLICKIDFN